MTLAAMRKTKSRRGAAATNAPIRQVGRAPTVEVQRLVCPPCGGVLDDVEVDADLTPVERELLDLLLHGYRVGQIALRLEVSVSTVRKRVRRLLAKTGTRSQAELIAV